MLEVNLQQTTNGHQARGSNISRSSINNDVATHTVINNSMIIHKTMNNNVNGAVVSGASFVRHVDVLFSFLLGFI